MATGISQSLGSVLIHGYTAAGVFYEPYLTETYDIASNTSTLSIAHRIRIMEEWGGRYDIPDSTPIYVTIDGTTTTYTFSSMPSVYPNNQAVTVQTTTHRVTHNSDGKKTITISCRWNNTSASYQGATQSMTVVLTTIPRASSMSFTTSQTMGSAYTFTINRASSSFTHSITWSFGGTSGTAVSKTSSTTPSYTPPIATFAPLCTTKTSAEITYTLNTYSGNELVGTASYKGTLAVPSSVVPSVSLTVSAVNPFNGLYLQGRSSVKLTASGSVSSAYGASISSYSFQVLNASSTAISSGSTSTSATSATHTSVLLTGSGTHTCKVTITDSRGRTATATRTITVTAYSKPVWGQVTSYRCNSAGESSNDGTYVALIANVSYSAVSGNSLSISYQYKAVSASSYGSSYSISNGQLTIVSSTTFSAQSAYQFKFTATDTVGNTITIETSVSSSLVGVAFHNGHKVLGLLMYPPTNEPNVVYMPKGYALAPDGNTFSKLITRADIGSGVTNDLLFTIPRTAYWDIGTAADAWNADTAEKWLKYVTANYGSKLGADRMVINELVAGVRHVIIGSAYDWTDLVSGMPKYCWFRVYSFANNTTYFSASNGTFNFRTMGEAVSTYPSSVSMPNSTLKQVASITLTQGLWHVRGTGNWNGGSGYRLITWQNTTNPSRDQCNTTAGTNSVSTFHELTRTEYFSAASTTVSLYAWQNSGSTISIWPSIKATRLG